MKRDIIIRKLLWLNNFILVTVAEITLTVLDEMEESRHMTKHSDFTGPLLKETLEQVSSSHFDKILATASERGGER